MPSVAPGQVGRGWLRFDSPGRRAIAGVGQPTQIFPSYFGILVEHGVEHARMYAEAGTAFIAVMPCLPRNVTVPSCQAVTADQEIPEVQMNRMA